MRSWSLRWCVPGSHVGAGLQACLLCQPSPPGPAAGEAAAVIATTADKCTVSPLRRWGLLWRCHLPRSTLAVACFCIKLSFFFFLVLDSLPFPSHPPPRPPPSSPVRRRSPSRSAEVESVGLTGRWKWPRARGG